jgi:hypothetical protein
MILHTDDGALDETLLAPVRADTLEIRVTQDTIPPHCVQDRAFRMWGLRAAAAQK